MQSKSPTKQIKEAAELEERDLESTYCKNCGGDELKLLFIMQSY